MILALRRPNERGVTLIEVMGSIAVFLICAVSLLGVFSASKKIAKQSSYAYNAHNLAIQRIELLKSLSFDAVANTGETDVRIDANGDPDDDGDYSRSTLITTNYGGRDDLTQVEVDVYYTFAGEFSPLPMEVTTVLVNTTNI